MKALDKVNEMAKAMGLCGKELEETMEYFKGRIKDSPTLAKDIEQETKTTDGLISYLQKLARKGAKKGMATVGSPTVFEWIEDYFYEEEKDTPEPKKVVAEKPKESTKKAKVFDFKPKKQVEQISLFDDEEIGETSTEDFDEWDNIDFEF